jgi:hypothetical protein
VFLSDFELSHVDAYHTHFEPSNHVRYDSSLNILLDSKPMSSQSDISLKANEQLIIGARGYLRDIMHLEELRCIWKIVQKVSIPLRKRIVMDLKINLALTTSTC